MSCGAADALYLSLLGQLEYVTDVPVHSISCWSICMHSIALHAFHACRAPADIHAAAFLHVSWYVQGLDASAIAGDVLLMPEEGVLNFRRLLRCPHKTRMSCSNNLVPSPNCHCYVNVRAAQDAEGGSVTSDQVHPHPSKIFLLYHCSSHPLRALSYI